MNSRIIAVAAAIALAACGAENAEAERLATPEATQAAAISASASPFPDEDPNFPWVSVTQGEVGDCWLVASLVAIAERAPWILKHQLAWNVDTRGASTLWTAQGNTVDIEVTSVDADFTIVANQQGWWLDEEQGASQLNAQFKLWHGGTTLASGEPAWLFAAMPVASSIDVIGSSDSALAELSDPNSVWSALSAGLPCVADSLMGPAAAFVTPNHSYTVLTTFLDSNGNRIVALRNPWGFDQPAGSLASEDLFQDGVRGVVYLPFADFMTNFHRVTTADFGAG